jgi:hypothetical protein
MSQLLSGLPGRLAVVFVYASRGLAGEISLLNL